MHRLATKRLNLPGTRVNDENDTFPNRNQFRRELFREPALIEVEAFRQNISEGRCQNSAEYRPSNAVPSTVQRNPLYA